MSVVDEAYWKKINKAGLAKDDPKLLNDRKLRDKLNSASIYVEDRLHCMDFKTGKQLWDVVLPRKGLSWHNLNWGARFQIWYGGGKVFVQGTSGAVYAVNAKDGSLAWQADFGPEMDAIFDNVVATASNDNPKDSIIAGAGSLKYWGTHVGGYIDGVTVFIQSGASNKKSGQNAPGGLYAFDAETGKQLWTKPLESGGTVAMEAMGFQRPGGPPMFLWARKDLIAIEPRSGKDLWRVPGNEGCNKVGRSGDYIVTTDSGGHLAAYETSDAGRACKQLWIIDGVWNGRHQVQSVHNGHVYTYGETQRKKVEGTRLSGGLTEDAFAKAGASYYACYDLKTGKLVDAFCGRYRWRDHHAMLSNGRIYCRDGVTEADPKNFIQYPTARPPRKGPDQPINHPMNAADDKGQRHWEPISYICPLLVDGYYLERMPFRVMCWDLRAKTDGGDDE